MPVEIAAGYPFHKLPVHSPGSVKTRSRAETRIRRGRENSRENHPRHISFEVAGLNPHPQAPSQEIMPPGKWPKDVHPRVIRRANEVTHLSRTEAVDILRASQRELNAHLRGVHLTQRLRDQFNTLSQRIATDPVANAIKTIADGMGGNADILLTLRMFVYLFYVADELQALLESEPLLDRRRKLLTEFSTVVRGLFSGRQVVDPSFFDYCLRDPAALTLMLKEGLGPIHTKWGTLDAQSRRKLIRDVLNTDKGYPKAARGVDDWSPANQVDLTRLVTTWLDSFANTSVFTGMSAPNTITIGQQISAGYAGTADRNLMWFTLFYKIGEALEIANDKAALRAAVQGGAAELVAAFNGVLAAADVQIVLNTDAFNAIWDTFM
ncbi:MAG TPA: hypothetical protein VE913_02025 [Longimicrobium sp.]|nr:hypothetical protein [Longimicrobium sp.]